MLSRERTRQGQEGEARKGGGGELLGCCCWCCERLFLYSSWQALLLPGKVGYREKELSPDAGREAASHRESNEAPLPLTVASSSLSISYLHSSFGKFVPPLSPPPLLGFDEGFVKSQRGNRLSKEKSQAKWKGVRAGPARAALAVAASPRRARAPLRGQQRAHASPPRSNSPRPPWSGEFSPIGNSCPWSY